MREIYEGPWEEHPMIQEALESICTEIELQVLRQILINIVKARFPSLVEKARDFAVRIDEAETLHILILLVVTSPHERRVYFLLNLVPSIIPYWWDEGLTEPFDRLWEKCPMVKRSQNEED